MLRIIGLAVAFTISALAQAELHLEATPKTAKANQPVQLRVLDPPPGIPLTWKKEKGDGSFDHGDSGPQVFFTPTKPGDIVKITCTPPGVSVKPGMLYLEVSDEDKPQDQQPHENAPKAAALPMPSHHTDTLPSDLVPSSAIGEPNQALGIPAGKMGDAQAVGGPVSPLRPPSSCKYDIECILFEYDLKRAQLGFAALAWQVVPQGAALNFGEFKGSDLSSKGFKSLRVWARVDSGASRLRVEFKSGGNVAPEYAASNSASYVVSTGTVSVDQDWREFCLDLPARGDALRNVVSPFTVVVSGAYNPAERIGLAIDAPSFSRQSCPRAASK